MWGREEGALQGLGGPGATAGGGGVGPTHSCFSSSWTLSGHPAGQSWDSREGLGLAHSGPGQGGPAHLGHIVSSSPLSLQPHFTDWGLRTETLKLTSDEVGHGARN